MRTKVITIPQFRKGLQEIIDFRNSDACFSRLVTSRIVEGIKQTVKDISYMPERNPIVAKNIRKAQYHDKPN